jgi:hypothetical protein
MDTESYRRWYDYSRARDLMLKATNSKHAPWHVIRSDDKRRAPAELHCACFEDDSLQEGFGNRVRLPKRSDKGRYNGQAGLRDVNFVAERY